MAPKPTLIIDADILAYQGASGAETVTNWGVDDDDGCEWQVVADEKSARKYVTNTIEELRDNLDADKVVLALSDTVNWRKDILPTYKGNRDSFRRPIILPHVRAYIRDKLDGWQRPKLEGDDLLGILSGLHSKFPGEKIMVTKDKDMSTLPGLHYRMHQDILGVFEVSTKEADLFHLKQGLAGDPTDGYTGCPGMGMTTAEEFLKEPYRVVLETKTLKSGKNVGTERTFWSKEPLPAGYSFSDLWQAMMSLYAKEGVSEADALIQFQVARILRTTDYDFKKKEPILWVP